jgi:glycosyltransferase involved in cell wall biosynthesis
MQGLIYIAHIRIPSHRAYAVNAMHMTEAFAQVFSNTVLFCERPRGSFTVDPSRVKVEYDIREIGFDLQFVNTVNIRFLNSAWFMVRVYSKILGDSLIKRCNHIIFTRDVLCALIGCVLGYKVVYEAHMPFAKWYQKLIFQLCMLSRKFYFMTITNALMREFLLVFSGVNKAKRIVLSDGARPRVDAICQIGSGVPLSCGYIGNLYPGKGMEVISKLAELDESIKYHIFGGLDSDVCYWKSRCPKNVIFYGHLTQSELQKKMDVFQVALAPLGEYISPDGGGDDIANWTSPLKIFEYMANKKVVVASNLPVLKEVLIDSFNSIIVPTSEPADWLASLNRISSNPNWAKKIALQGNMDLVNHFQWLVRARNIKRWLSDNG